MAMRRRARLAEAGCGDALLPSLPGEQAELLAAAQQLLQVQPPRQLDAVPQHAVKVQIRLHAASEGATLMMARVVLWHALICVCSLRDFLSICSKAGCPASAAQK